MAAIARHGMTPIVCVGETLDEREAGRDRGQGARSDRRRPRRAQGAEQVATWVIAYEPIWAIGTGRTATAEDAQAVCARDPGRGRRSFDDAPPAPSASSTADR